MIGHSTNGYWTDADHAGPSDTRRRRWTDDDIATVDRMRSDGRTFREIALHLGRTEASVGQANRLRGRLAHRMCWTPAVVKELRDLVASGRTTDEIAAHYGISTMAVHVRKSVDGLTSRPTVSADLASRVAELTAAGRTIRQIMAETGESRSRVAFIIRREGAIPTRPVLRKDVRPIDADIIRLADAGMNRGSIARSLGLAHGSVSSRLQTLRRRQLIRERGKHA